MRCILPAILGFAIGPSVTSAIASLPDGLQIGRWSRMVLPTLVLTLGPVQVLAQTLSCGVAEPRSCAVPNETSFFDVPSPGGVAVVAYVQTTPTDPGSLFGYEPDCSTPIADLSLFSGDRDDAVVGAGTHCLKAQCVSAAPYAVEYNIVTSDGPLCEAEQLDCAGPAATATIAGPGAGDLMKPFVLHAKPGETIRITVQKTGGDAGFVPWTSVFGPGSSLIVVPTLQGEGTFEVPLPPGPQAESAYSLFVWDGEDGGCSQTLRCLTDSGSFSIAIESCCGNGVREPGEECDLGIATADSGNCPADACTVGESCDPACEECPRSCTADCRLRGRCSASGGCCTTTADCAGGGSCCGNGIVEAPEECDDGNLVGGDTCTPQCTAGTGPPFVCCPPGSEVAGSTVATNRKLKLTKLGGTAGDDRLNSPGETVLLPGQAIRPCSEAFSYCLERDGGVVYGPDPTAVSGPSPALPGSAFGPKPPCIDELSPRRVRATFRDKTTLASEPDGLKRVQFKNNKSQPNKFKHQVQVQNANLSGVIGATRLRQTLVVGDTCMTSVLTCVDKSAATKVCTPTP